MIGYGLHSYGFRQDPVAMGFCELCDEYSGYRQCFKNESAIRNYFPAL